MATIIIVGIMILGLLGFIAFPRLTIIISLYVSGVINLMPCIFIGFIAFLFDVMVGIVYGESIERREKYLKSLQSNK